MKNVIKFILSVICYIMMIPLLLALTVCVTWFVLPDFQTTFIGQWLGAQLPDPGMFIATCAVAGSTILLFILSRVFRVVKSSKANNFYTHLITWILALVLSAESLFTLFTTTSSLVEANFEFTLVRKIGIISGGVGLLLYSILSPKVGKLVDRKIQAYDTAKELNQAGRSSVIWMQILKTLDFCFPELILLTVLCFAFDFNIAVYFIYIICSFVLPIIGNMICDARVKDEAKRVEEEKVEAQVNATAEAVAELLQQRGNQ